MRKLIISSLAVALLAALSTAGASATTPAPIDVNGCGITIPAKTVGVAQSDFTCTASGTGDNKYYGIVLARGAALNLNGHTITLVQDQYTIAPVRCLSNCAVYDGTITNAATGGGAGISIAAHGRLDVHDVTVTNITMGVEAPVATVIAKNVSINARFAGIYIARRIDVDHVDVTVTNTDHRADCLGATQAGGKVTGHDATLTGCEYGVSTNGSVDLRNLTVTNTRVGVFAGGTIHLRDSSVTGSAYADVFSRHRPKLVNTTCDVSVRQNKNTSWHVCAND